jgi:hypothetical protein
VVPASPAIPPAASASPVMPFAGDGLDPYLDLDPDPDTEEGDVDSPYGFMHF